MITVIRRVASTAFVMLCELAASHRSHPHSEGGDHASREPQAPAGGAGRLTVCPRWPLSESHTIQGPLPEKDGVLFISTCSKTLREDSHWLS